MLIPAHIELQPRDYSNHYFHFRAFLVWPEVFKRKFVPSPDEWKYDVFVETGMSRGARIRKVCRSVVRVGHAMVRDHRTLATGHADMGSNRRKTLR